MNTFLNDKIFLKKLDEYPIREIYVKIIALTHDEQPIDEIQGRATAGSINLDGDSAVRRTCSLTLLADDLDLRDYYWGLKNKFKLEVGMKNFVDKNYPEIIWFPQGVFIITQFNTSQTTSGYQISISGKDKMVLLNGEVTGKINAISTRLDIIEDLTYNDDGTIKDRIETKIPIREIIQELVHEYGGEPLQNIIINDVDNYGLELLEYRGEDGLFIGVDPELDQIRYFNIDNDFPFWYYNPFSTQLSGSNFSLIDEGRLSFVFSDYLNTEGLGMESSTTHPSLIILNPNDLIPVEVAKINYGQTAGYRLTELTYPGELVVSVGETITGVLDKIKTMLNDFEYFYDINGRFVFQRKPIYINQSWNTLKNDGYEDEYGKHDNYSESMMDVSPITYQFQDNNLLISISNTPNYSNLKNDFSIWGKRTTMSGAEVPIHLRYAIQKKPISYKKMSDAGDFDAGTVFINQDNQTKTKSENPLEITEEMAAEMQEQFQSMVFTGDGTNKTVLNGFIYVDWREIIYQMALDYRNQHYKDDFEYRLKQLNNGLYPDGKTGYEQYYVDMEAFWRDLYNPKYAWTSTMTDEELEEKGFNREGWSTKIKEDPQGLNFWIDFLDTDGDMGKYAVDVIGDRVQVINDDKIKALWYPRTPTVIFYDKTEEATINRSKSGYTYVSASGINNLFSVSTQGKSAKDELDNQLQNYSLCTESTSITALPIYYLQPNTRIRVKNNDNININGEYIMSKITLPLTHNGTMSITAVKDSQTLL